MMVGATRESVTRTLTKLRRLGAIETRRKGIVVFDPDRLRAMASATDVDE